MYSRRSFVNEMGNEAQKGLYVCVCVCVCARARIEMLLIAGRKDYISISISIYFCSFDPIEG